MSKQSFVTGQVLTAQQVNDLQTNDFNQTVSAKTASYTLVAADKGTRITMSSTSATTITVNTGLFAAGDTLFIQNLNTGVSTITAGTATVDTSASLALAQHEGGTLYFTSAGVSTFFKAAGATPAAGGMTLLSTTSLTGSSVTVSSISQSYKHLLILCRDLYLSTPENLRFRLNGDTGSNYFAHIIRFRTTTQIEANTDTSSILISAPSISAYDEKVKFEMNLYRYTETEQKIFNSRALSKPSAAIGYESRYNMYSYNSTTAISSFTLFPDGGTFSSGTLYIYGVS